MNFETVITWNTHKRKTGFEFVCYTVGYQQMSITLQRGHRDTRAQAVAAAKQSVRYFKWSQENLALVHRPSSMALYKKARAVDAS